MTELSVTITAGEGCERHNHDLSYRETLEHVHSRPNGVIELVPYEGYYYTMDETMRPYLEEYNNNVEKRYHAAWDRYNAGIIKTKPRKRDFQKITESYVYENLGRR